VARRDLSAGGPPAALGPVAQQIWRHLAKEAFWLSRADRPALIQFCESAASWRMLQTALEETSDPDCRRFLDWRLVRAEDELRQGAVALSLLALPRWRHRGPGEDGIEVFVAWAMRE
jgi:hypothetical protein